MSKIEKIKQFNILMETFLTQISPLVGTSYKHYFSKLIKANALLPIKQFYVYVEPHKKQIINRDESYFKNTDNYHDYVHNDRKDKVFEEIIRLNTIYDKLDKKNREEMWLYFQALLVLSEEYNNSYHINKI